MSDAITLHDITANGKDYILEWTHDGGGQGYIAITETCKVELSEDDDDCGENHETYDFREVES